MLEVSQTHIHTADNTATLNSQIQIRHNFIFH